MTYKNDARPHEWYTELAGPHPKLMNDFLSEGAEVEPSHHPFDAKRRWHVMDNSVSSTEWEEIVWTPDRVAVDLTEPKTSTRNGHGFVDSLAVDDRIVLLARALVSSISPLFQT